MKTAFASLSAAISPRHAEQHIEAGWSEGTEVMRYAIVIETAGANFSAYVPYLPGCVATGSTVSATEENVRAAIRFHIDGLKDDQLPIPAPNAIADDVEA